MQQTQNTSTAGTSGTSRGIHTMAAFRRCCIVYLSTHLGCAPAALELGYVGQVQHHMQGLVQGVDKQEVLGGGAAHCHATKVNHLARMEIRRVTTQLTVV
jgi:hypothetical protein